MSYNKTIWTAGDTITSEKLNNIEDGIEAADKPTYSPEAVIGEGDVSVTYNGNQIGVLSESGNITLETASTIATNDIEIEYTKPSGHILKEFSFVNTTGGLLIDIGMGAGALLYAVNNVVIYGTATDNQSPLFDTASYYVPLFDEKENEYVVEVVIHSNTDAFNVTLNNAPVEYNSLGQSYSARLVSDDVTTLPNMAITLSAKA